MMLRILVKLPTPLKTFMIWVSDFLVAAFSVVVSIFLMRGIFPQISPQLLGVILGLAAFNTLLLFQLGLYRELIRYLNDRAFLRTMAATLFTSVLYWVLIITADFEAPPVTTPVLFWFLVTSGILLSRYVAKVASLKNQKANFKAAPVAIYGAGEAGSQIVRALQSNRDYKPVVFFDDNPELQGRTVSGLNVISPKLIPETLEKLNCSQILLAIPSADRARKRQLIEYFSKQRIQIRMLPAVEEIVAGQVHLSDLREVGIEDLLGRDPVPPFPQLIESCIRNKVVLVSGAGGSIGSELTKQAALHNPRLIVLFEQSEFNLYQISQELEKRFPETKFVSVLGDVLDEKRLEILLKTYQVQTFYHAAAYKHVPLVEFNPISGLKTNVLGSASAIRAAVCAEVETFVLISTDKAVRPTNIMGATKRLAELVVHGLGSGQTKTKIAMVRFGNVLGSSGSVVPLFKEQIKNGGPVTVTHRDVTRYFMTIPEAAQLVIQAGAMGDGADIFVLDMGDPLRIYDLAEKMISLSGFQVAKDGENGIEIKITGLRSGEKLYEELLIGDHVTRTQHPRILMAKEPSFTRAEIQDCLLEAQRLCEVFEQEKAQDFLKKWVREYGPTFSS